MKSMQDVVASGIKVGSLSPFTKPKRKKTKSQVGVRKVDLGKAGAFTIRHPGEFKEVARSRGMSTAEAASQLSSSPGRIGRMARAAKGLMAMGGKK